MTTKVSLAIHPGEHIADELEERAMTAAELARAMGVDPARVSRLANGQTSVTGDTALRLAVVFGSSPAFWIRLQGDYDIARARVRSALPDRSSPEDRLRTPVPVRLSRCRPHLAAGRMRWPTAACSRAP